MKVDENLAVVCPIFWANIDTWNAPKFNMLYRGLDALDVRFILGRPLEFHYLSKLVPAFEVGGVRKRGHGFRGIGQQPQKRLHFRRHPLWDIYI